jgi:formylglycine-generating enzyme required for sulfatase activity
MASLGWYDANSGDKTHNVATKKPNELGLYDMSGNAWEWCRDWYDYYSSSPSANPKGPYLGAERVLRGGSWISSATECRVADRNFSDPSRRYDGSGFRVAITQ